jgi:hypothetical protein
VQLLRSRKLPPTRTDTLDHGPAGDDIDWVACVTQPTCDAAHFKLQTWHRHHRRSFSNGYLQHLVLFAQSGC